MGMKKIVVNTMHDHLDLDDRLIEDLLDEAGIKYEVDARGFRHVDGYEDCFLVENMLRENKSLIAMVEAEELENRAVIEIPEGVEYIICADHEGFGGEWIEEKHRSWRCVLVENKYEIKEF